MNYKIEITQIGKIIIDEKTDEKPCYPYYFSGEKENGYGVIESTREKCINELFDTVNEEIIGLSFNFKEEIDGCLKMRRTLQKEMTDK